MKKMYIKPTVDEFAIEMKPLMDGSIIVDGNNANVNGYEDNYGEEFCSRGGYDDWD